MLFTASIDTNADRICFRVSMTCLTLFIGVRSVIRTRLDSNGRISCGLHFTNSGIFKFCIAVKARALTFFIVMINANVFLSKCLCNKNAFFFKKSEYADLFRSRHVCVWTFYKENSLTVSLTSRNAAWWVRSQNLGKHMVFVSEKRDHNPI